MRFLHPPGTGLGVHSILPEEREDRVGRALVRVTDAHILDAWVDKLPPDRPIVSFRDAYAGETEKISMYAAEHYLETGSSHTMEKRLEAGQAVSSLPDGVALRPFDMGRQARKLYEMVRAVSGTADYRSYENWRDRYHVDEAWFDPALWTLAWERDQIVGCAICFPDIYEEPHQTGWIDWIGVRTERRKAGIGRRLLEQSVVHFQKRSFARIKARVPSDLGPALMASLTSSGWHIQFTKLTFEKELGIGEFSLHSLGDTD
jgi:ribosomal protein S18 acetylase RimI-like enzyme